MKGAINPGGNAEQLDIEWCIRTPEHHTFTCRPAGPLPRAIAWMLDLMVRAIIVVVLAAAFSLMGQVGLGFILITSFIVIWFYGALFEAWNKGRTPGKIAMRLRVIGQDGSPATGPSCIIRNFLILADFLPAGFFTGMISMLSTKGFRRLGDLAAGTLVIYEESFTAQNVSPVLEHEVMQTALLLPRGLPLRLPLPAQRALTAYVAKRNRFHPSRRNELAQPLAGSLALYLDQPQEVQQNPDTFICAVQLCACYPGFDIETALAHFTDSRVYDGNEKKPGPDAWRGYMSTRKQNEAFGEEGFSPVNSPKRWKELEMLLSQRIDITPPQASELSRLTRAVGADLALADANHLPESATAYLQDLVARAHLHLYHGSANWLRRIVHMVVVHTPRMLYRDGCLRLAVTTFFGIFMLCMIGGILRPGLAEDVLGRAMIDQMETMYASAPRDRDAETASLMTGYYISHNVGIAFACFATGIFLGLGSLVMLAYNGLVLGLIFGHMYTVNAPINTHFFEFVTAHAPFELMGIAMAGAAGLRMGWGIVWTEGRTRLASLRRSAADAVPIVSSAGVLIGLAAYIEAFVSPSGLPHAAKAAVAIGCTLLLIGYLGGLGYLQTRRRGRIPQ